MKPVNQRAFCPYCGSRNVEAFTRNAFFGGTYTYYYCNDCRSVMLRDELLDDEERRDRF